MAPWISHDGEARGGRILDVFNRRATTPARERPSQMVAGRRGRGTRSVNYSPYAGCCRLASVNSVEYLADVLPRLARRIRLRDMYALMPARWPPSESLADVAPEQAATQE
jgi:hypothetical protein